MYSFSYLYHMLIKKNKNFLKSLKKNYMHLE